MVNVPSLTEQPGALTRPVSTRDLLPSENRFLVAMQELGFGSVESAPIRNGELVLDPWPTIIRSVKFGSEAVPAFRPPTEEFLLKRQVVEFFECVRSIESGEIRCLNVRHGLPLGMEVIQRNTSSGGHCGC